MRNGLREGKHTGSMSLHCQGGACLQPSVGGLLPGFVMLRNHADEASDGGVLISAACGALRLCQTLSGFCSSGVELSEAKSWWD